MSEREVGIVKWFNNKKGYGFIESESRNEDIFAHFRQIRGEGFKTLVEGEKVEFTTVEGKNGLQADDIDRLSKSE